MWQLDRARELKASENAVVEVDRNIYPLNEITEANGPLPVAAFGKTVTATGYYIANYRAPNQKSASGELADWEVALMQVDTSSAILVVRGLWSDRLLTPEIVMSTKVTITGAIMPSQYEDRARSSASDISRLDSSVLTAATDVQLYDGFIAIATESYRGGEITRNRIDVALPKGEIPGYYWQHISYVVVWWVMAALVLWAPFYKRRESSESAA